MAGPRFADLVAEGGEVEEGPSEVGSFIRNAAMGGVANLGDEMEGAQQATALGLLGGGKALLSGDWETVKRTPKAVLETYRAIRDGRRAVEARDYEVNPNASAAGNVVGAVGSGLATGGIGGGLRGALAMGALEGAAGGFGASEEDLTYQDARAYAQVFGDTLKGGGAGAAGGGLGYGVAAGLRKVGTKASEGLGRARRELLDEARGARAVEDEALQQAEVGAQRKLAVQQQDAQKMDRARAREVAREKMAAERKARASSGRAPRAAGERTGPSEDTDVLQGYRGAAGRRWADNDPKVRGYMKELEDPNLPPARRQKLEQFLSGHGDAFKDPAAFERRIMVEEMRKAGYSPEQVERIMIERVTPELKVRSRRAPEPPPSNRTPAALPETTQAGDWEDLARIHGENPAKVREEVRGPGSRNMGARALGEDTNVQWNRETLEQQGGSAPDPFHDAKTKVALIRTTPPEGAFGDAFTPDGDMHRFEFRAGNGQIFEANIGYSPKYPDQLEVMSIHPKGVKTKNYIEMGKEHANSVGPRDIYRLAEELRRYFPKAKKLYAERHSGWNPYREMDMRLPEVTEPHAVRLKDAGPQQPLYSRGTDGPYRDWPEAEATANEAWPAGAGDDVVEDVAPVRASEEPLPGLREPTRPSARALRGDVAPRTEPEVLPDMEELTHPGAPFPEGVQRFDVLGDRPATRAGQPYSEYGAPRRSALPPEDAAAAEEAMAARRAAAAGAEVGMGGRVPMSPEPAAGARPRAMPPEDSMRAPVDEAPLPPEATRATAVPEVRRPVPQPLERPRVVDRGGQTRLGQAPLDVRMAARPSPEEVAAAREKGALLEVGLAGYEGARRAHNFVAAPIGALVGVTKEALKNPAVRARALSIFKLDRLAKLRPEVWGRVGSALSRAMEKGPDKYAATRHAYLLRDPEFRAADAEVAKELAGLDDDALAERLRGVAGAGGE